MTKKISIIAFIISICLVICFFYSKNLENFNFSSNKSCNKQLLSRIKKHGYTITPTTLDKEKLLYINIGIDYLPQEIIECFQELTGIKVIVDVFDSNEVLEAKLLAGSTQYDVVFPTAWPYLSRLIKAKVFQKLQKKHLAIYDLNAKIYEKLQAADENNLYAIPFQWGISGIGYNKEIIKKYLPDAQIDSLDIILNEKNLKILSKFGVSIYESPDELFPTLLAYLNLDPESQDLEEYKQATDHLMKIRKYISKFTSYGFEDLVSNNACVAFATSGDIINVIKQRKKLYGKSDICFIAPKEGTSLWIDVAVIPIKAPHVENAHVFLNFLLHPVVSAEIVNQTMRATAVMTAMEYIDVDLINEPAVYPSEETIDKSYVERIMPSEISAYKTRSLTRVKCCK